MARICHREIGAPSIGAAKVAIAARLAKGAERGGDGSGDSAEAEVQTKL
ncbi:MAG TPA: hypothetical protein VN902_19160 [Candidatus Acidoferrales bacterium]|jgi:hypothetical protein|nr:hypothetical protein [Candidatus Acidoferrales bacterium]